MDAIRQVGTALSAAGITWALGGSAVLIAHGLQQVAPSDWDVTVDADPETVRAALAAVAYTENPRTGDGIYATGARLVIEPNVDLLCQFAIRTETGIIYLPTVVSRTWEGLPVGSPEVWAVAYRLMDRPAKADLLTGYLLSRGADPAVKAALLAQPLPLMLRDEVEAWPDRAGVIRATEAKVVPLCK